jgi:hypothetical protein
LWTVDQMSATNMGRTAHDRFTLHEIKAKLTDNTLVSEPSSSHAECTYVSFFVKHLSIGICDGLVDAVTLNYLPISCVIHVP